MGGWLGIAKIKPTQPQLGLAGALAELGNKAKFAETLNSEWNIFPLDKYVIYWNKVSWPGQGISISPSNQLFEIQSHCYTIELFIMLH